MCTWMYIYIYVCTLWTSPHPATVPQEVSSSYLLTQYFGTDTGRWQHKNQWWRWWSCWWWPWLPPRSSRPTGPKRQEKNISPESWKSWKSCDHVRARMTMLLLHHVTPQKFNIAAEKLSSQKESSLPRIIFQGQAVKLRGSNDEEW